MTRPKIWADQEQGSGEREGSALPVLLGLGLAAGLMFVGLRGRKKAYPGEDGPFDDVQQRSQHQKTKTNAPHEKQPDIPLWQQHQDAVAQWADLMGIRAPSVSAELLASQPSGSLRMEHVASEKSRQNLLHLLQGTATPKAAKTMMSAIPAIELPSTRLETKVIK